MQNYQPYTPQSNRTILLSTRIIFFAFLVGQLLFLMVTLFITRIKGFSFTTGDPLCLVVPIVAILTFTAGTFLYGKYVVMAAGKETPKKKLVQFQTAMIIRMALTQGSCLFAIVSFMLSGNLFFTAIAGILIMMFITQYPSTDKVLTSLNLTNADIDSEAV